MAESLTPETQILILRWVLGVAREDRDALKLVAHDLGDRHPLDIIVDLASLAVGLAGACSALGFVQAFHNDPDFRERSRDHDGAIEVIGLWMQAVLDDRDYRGE